MGASKAKKVSGQPSGPSIFVVDDEPLLLEMAAKILGRYQVQTFSDPEKALAAYSTAQMPPDLVITDFAMHKMDGLDLIRECRRLHPRQKIVLLSGTVDEMVYYGTGVKPDRFLEKPYKPGELAELVQEILAD